MKKYMFFTGVFMFCLMLLSGVIFTLLQFPNEVARVFNLVIQLLPAICGTVFFCLAVIFVLWGPVR